MQKENYYKMEEIIKYIYDNKNNNPKIEEIATKFGFKADNFQKEFINWVGISPKKFLGYLTIEYIKNKIYDISNVCEISDYAGLSAQSRVYDLFVNIEAMTPNEYKTKGKGLNIEYGFHDTPFGECIVAITKRGLCGLGFVINNDYDKALNEIKEKWELSNFIENKENTKDIVNKIFYGELKKGKLNLLLKGTNFQIKVWEALLKIPEGILVSYQTIANHIENPKAIRAVGTAIGSNPISYLIPCHRVIRKECKIGNYYWGSGKKKMMIGYELHNFS
ncbi:MAG: methylated-DNA--[protein]-cysteine S-methyltransferase [Candidatus Sericytochromatia bacterium]